MLGYAWLGFFSDRLFVPHSDIFPVLTPLLWKVSGLGAALCWLASLVAHRKDRARYPRTAQLTPEPFILMTLIGLWTDFPERRDSFPLSRAGAFGGLVLGVITAVAQSRRRTPARVTEGNDRAYSSRLFTAPGCFFLAQIVLWLTFLHTADGRLLWSDDHPSFLYRLTILWKHFPHVLFYNTDWNGGYPTRELFATGSLGLYFLTWPLIALAPTLDTLEGATGYTVVVATVLIFFIPWFVYATARVLRWSRVEASIAGLLALAPSMAFFEYALQYGTLSFLISCSLAPLAIALILRIAFDEKSPSVKFDLALLVTGALCLVWHASGILFVPVSLVLLWHVKQLFRTSRIPRLGAAALLIGVLQIPSIVALTDEAYLQKFFGAKGLPGSDSSHSLHGTSMKKQNNQADEGDAVDSKRDSRSAHTPKDLSTLSLFELRLSLRTLVRQIPLTLLMLGFPACLSLRRGTVRQTFIATVLWCVALGTVGSAVKPQLELHRMAYPATLMLVLALAWTLVDWVSARSSLTTHSEHRTGGRMRRGLELLPLVLAPVILPAHLLGAGAIYRDQSNISLTFAPPYLSGFLDAMRSLPQGRTFFLGFILHDLGSTTPQTQDGGHIAPLASLSGRELYASHYYHTHWATIDPIPKSYRDREEDGVEEFLDLVNATSVVAFKKEWIRYCAEHPRYKEVWTNGRFHLYTRTSEHSGYFLSGSGIVSRTRDGLQIDLNSTEAIIKYRWHAKLQSSAPEQIEIFSVPMFSEDLPNSQEKEVSFIGLRLKEASKTTLPLAFSLSFSESAETLE